MNAVTPLEYLRERKIIAIARGVNPAHILRLGDALLAGGIRMLELTYDQQAPETWAETASAIRTAEQRFGEELLIGAGTVIAPEQVWMTVEAGGRYIVTPAVQPDIIRMAKKTGIGAFPGAFTPSEILTAHEAGADAVKVFPAGVLGPEYIRAVRAPLSHIPLIAVGGVSAGNAAGFLRAGCIGLGIGGNLVNREWMAAGEWNRIAEAAKEIVQAVSGSA